VLVGGALLGHPGEDVVGGAVQDAHDTPYPVAGERFLQRFDDRDRTGDGRLVGEIDPGGPGRGVQLRTLLGDELLVGGDHRFAVLQGSADQGPGRLDAAHHLDDDVHIIGVNDVRGIVGEDLVGKREATITAEVADDGPRHLQLRAGPRGDVVGLTGEDRDDPGTDGAAAEQADPDDTVQGATSRGGTRRAYSSRWPHRSPAADPRQGA